LTLAGDVLLEQGRAALARVGRSRFSAAQGVASEFEYKRRSVAQGRVMYHAHIGLSTWPATSVALNEVTGALGSAGYRLDRFGLCLDRGMGLPPERRADVPKETGPRLDDEDWDAVAQAGDSQPHLGDFMIGTEASLENTIRALGSGITTIGNLGQFFSFDTPGGGDNDSVVSATVRALGAMSAARSAGAVVHSYLDDGLAMQFENYGNYLAWAALESYLVENLAGARLTHCYGGLVPQPVARAFLGLTLRRLHGDESMGSMVYGNTVDYTRDHTHNSAVMSTYLLVDIATQLQCPTGHAVHPVPFTENSRIPSAADIIEVHLLAHEIEREARRSGALFNWSALEAQAAVAAEYATATSRRMLQLLDDDGVDTTDLAAMLATLRGMDIPAFERRLGVTAPEGFARLQPWKAESAQALFTDVLSGAQLSLAGEKVVLASMDVHDLARDVMRGALVQLGAEVVLLPTDSLPEAVAGVAIAEDASAVIVSTYNGTALTQGRSLMSALNDRGYDGILIMGGILNQDNGDDLPVDVTDDLVALGIHCPARLNDVAPLISHHTGGQAQPT
jgi:methylmalonyl-CoA mutase cobalamin-binding domain/chain